MDGHAIPRSAASVVLLRERAGAVEVLMMRRPATASFVADSYVFPGGATQTGEEMRAAAVRELCEETGLLLVESAIGPAVRARVRARLRAGESLAEVAAAQGFVPALASLQPFARWVTPSSEPKRFAAEFFLARLPSGQEAEIDGEEAVAAVWLPPQAALAERATLRLMPPQVHILTDLAARADQGSAGMFAWAQECALHPWSVVPRLAHLPGVPGGAALLLPWDPLYETHGLGEGQPTPVGHPLAVGPSRFVLRDGGWHLESGLTG